MENTSGQKSTAAASTATELASICNDGFSVAAAGGTTQDGADMSRMGKQQVLKRNFRFVSIVGFGLYNGGTGGVIWCTIGVWLCIMAMIASMAEMASIAPTGGQYHWVSEFAPDSCQKPLSYLVGWCCLGWVSGIPACGQLLVGLVQGMVLLVYPDANVTQLWQTTLMIYLFLLLTFAFNVWAAKYLPAAESVVLGIHIAGFIVFMAVLWSMGEHISAKQVFTQFHDGGGWGSIGLSTLVGLSTPLWCFIGPDCGAHMSEELRDASLQLPRAIMWATFFNGVLGISMLITFCFCVNDINAILNAGSGIAILNVFYDITSSHAAAIILGTLLVVLTFFSTVTVIATSSRQCWAFARDGGFPFSAWISKVGTSHVVPINALIVCFGVSFILAAINFGSDVALNAIISVSNAALIFSYIISVGCIRLRRPRGQQLLARRWSLGKYGGPLNDITLGFLSISLVFSFFPVAPVIGDPTWAVDFNWAIVMFAATLLLALVYHLVGGRDRYVPPIRLCKQA